MLFYSILPLENAILSGVINAARICAPILVSFSVSDTGYAFHTTFEFCEMPQLGD